MFPRDFWYVAAWDWDVRGQALMPRTICNEPVVFWRMEDAAPKRKIRLVSGAATSRPAPCAVEAKSPAPRSRPAHRLRIRRAGPAARRDARSGQHEIGRTATEASEPARSRARYRTGCR